MNPFTGTRTTPRAQVKKHGGRWHMCVWAFGGRLTNNFATQPAAFAYAEKLMNYVLEQERPKR